MIAEELTLLATALLSCAAISAVFKTRLGQSLQAWLPTLLTPIITLAFIFLVLRPLLYETYTAPTNLMAPTLIGEHWQGICPECGRPNYCSPTDPRFSSAIPPLMICDGFHVTSAAENGKQIHAGDRFLVAKFLSPRRWDLLVFLHPEDPSTLYVKRLIGLPGEEIRMRDGSVWVNGERQTPPDSARGIEYLSAPTNLRGQDLWGSTTRPALLGDDEYFVLNDFSAQPMDSRCWKQGAPGHNPYAVPESHIRGVVTHTYWPPRRWRIHR
ncbi:MAG: signal peptidase I [Planctomycetales bacterium]|nr:signal peptidase I [Planctomycetales bacterium]